MHTMIASMHSHNSHFDFFFEIRARAHSTSSSFYILSTSVLVFLSKHQTLYNSYTSSYKIYNTTREYYHTKEKYEHFKRSKSVGDSWAMYRSMVSLSRMESRVDGFKRAIGLKWVHCCICPLLLIRDYCRGNLTSHSAEPRSTDPPSDGLAQHRGET